MQETPGCYDIIDYCHYFPEDQIEFIDDSGDGWNLFWVDGGRGRDLALCYSHRHNLEQELCDDADNFDHYADDKHNLEQEHCADCDDERNLCRT